MVKNLPTNSDTSSIPGSGRSPEVRNGTSHQYSRLENSVDRGAWWATLQEVTKSWMRLSTQELAIKSVGATRGSKPVFLLGGETERDAESVS